MSTCLRFGAIVLTITWVISGCSISDRIKNKYSESTFELMVFADDTCKLTINNAELSNLSRKASVWKTMQGDKNYYDICSAEGGYKNYIFISSMYPNIINPPMAYANEKSTVSNYYLTEHMYFTKTMVFPITSQWRLFLTKTNPYFAIDKFAEVQMLIKNPDWESLNYSSSYARGLAFNGYQLTAVQGEATFYGVSEIASHNVLYKLVGTIIRTSH